MGIEAHGQVATAGSFPLGLAKVHLPARAASGSSSHLALLGWLRAADYHIPLSCGSAKASAEFQCVFDVLAHSA